MDKKQFILNHKRISSQFNELLNEWDFLGVVKLGVMDEYQDLIGPLLAKLQENSNLDSFEEFVQNVVVDKYEVNPKRIKEFTQKVIAWWEKEPEEEKFFCLCCGYKTLREKPPGTFDICKICDWEDDFSDGGAN